MRRESVEKSELAGERGWGGGRGREALWVDGTREVERTWFMLWVLLRDSCLWVGGPWGEEIGRGEKRGREEQVGGPGGGGSWLG